MLSFLSELQAELLYVNDVDVVVLVPFAVVEIDLQCVYSYTSALLSWSQNIWVSNAGCLNWTMSLTDEGLPTVMSLTTSSVSNGHRKKPSAMGTSGARNGLRSVKGIVIYRYWIQFNRSFFFYLQGEIHSQNGS